ncbi:MAG TPA: hypothetical protein DCE41_18120, partial [Cytophagales bacterium]|nr:hypothetical protein [Cytophagales bacterium]
PVARQVGERVDRVASYLSSLWTLADLSPEPITLLQRMACLPSDYHDAARLTELLAGSRSEAEDQEDDATPPTTKALDVLDLVLDLVDLGWLLKSDGAYKLHQVVQTVVLDQSPPSREVLAPVISVLTQKLNYDQFKDNPVDFFPWLPFGEALQRVIDHVGLPVDPKLAKFWDKLGRIYVQQGKYVRARNLWEKAVAFAEAEWGPEHARTAMYWNNFAYVLDELGAYTEAKGYYTKAIRYAEQHLGLDHKNTAGAYSNLAAVLQALGEYAEARTYLEKAIASDEKNFGTEHPKTAIRYSNLAVVLQDLGELAEARTYLEKALASDEKNFGTATIYNNMASLLEAMGEYTEALTWAEKAMMGKVKLPEGHPSRETGEQLLVRLRSKLEE